MRLISLTFLTLFIFYAPLSNSQDRKDCVRGDKTIAQNIQACKEITTNRSKTDGEVARSARQIGVLLWIDKKEPAEMIIGYFLLSAQKGLLTAFADIGDLYRNGYTNLKPDYERALYYYRQDTSYSNIRLKGEGEMLLSGQGLKQSTDSAINAFIAAASLNDEDASIRSKLCGIYSTDKYEKKDLIMAHFWCSNAVDTESSAILKGWYEKLKIDLEVQMSPAQLSASNRIKQECLKLGLLTLIKR